MYCAVPGAAFSLKQRGCQIDGAACTTCVGCVMCQLIRLNYIAHAPPVAQWGDVRACGPWAAAALTSCVLLPGGWARPNTLLRLPTVPPQQTFTGMQQP